MLAPDLTDAQEQIIDVFNSNGALTAAVHALENTQLMSLPANPDWYTSIESTLSSAQSSSMSWLTNTSPTLFATATQSYIDYANLFATSATAMQTIVQQIQAAGNTPTSTQQTELAAIVQNLQTTAQAKLTACSALQTQVDSFRASMETLQDSLDDAVQAGLDDEATDEAAIETTQADIDELMITMTKYSTKADSATFSSDTACVSTAIALTFKLALSEGVLGAGTILTAVYSTYELTLAIVYTEKEENIINKIVKELATLEDEEVALVLTQSVVTSLETLMDTITLAMETFTDLTTIWEDVVDDLEWLQVVLAQPQIDVSRIPALLDLSDAMTTWSSISEYASWAQKQPLTQTLTLPTQTVTSTQAA